ncbi:hypothetical protein DFH07DRAFT_934986 [Mycena maculata]|uniref:Uncharacterized protein n=1 Tax=Mycena maculata TaxID=230809 RepID=A0AAD7KGL5_9AGAR|nr:hypothetical protein DFH07DRAFT_940198 [Mycena maculata]KAJ7785168.1 hypothetical protein DFH07DRAFT_934986 [Mycena maculata]
MSTELTVFDSATAPAGLSDRMLAFNSIHYGLKRHNKRYFHFSQGSGEPVIFDARTIRLYADYNVALCSGEDIPDLAPAFYIAFAKEMNTHDESGFGWAYIEDGVIVWDDKLTPANPESYCVLDHETTDRLLGPDEVAVSKPYVENAERLIYMEQQRDLKYYRLRQEKKLQRVDPVFDVTSKAAKDNFAKKRKALEEAAREEAAKKSKGGMDTS